MHAGATQLDHLASERFVRRKIEFALAVITEIRRRQLARLQPICADDRFRGDFLDDQVIAKLVEWIDVEPGRVRFSESFAKLEIKNLKPQLLGATHFVYAARQPRRVPWTRRPRIRDRSACFDQCVQPCSPVVLLRAPSSRFDDSPRSRGPFRRGSIRKTARDRASVDHPCTWLCRRDTG